jgi:hypothetical protein
LDRRTVDLRNEWVDEASDGTQEERASIGVGTKKGDKQHRCADNRRGFPEFKRKFEKMFKMFIVETYNLHFKWFEQLLENFTKELQI